MPREEVEIFSLCMEEKLRRNDHKGGWEKIPIRDLLKRLKDEVDELDKAIHEEGNVNIMYEAADVANFAMMIAWNTIRNIGNIREENVYQVVNLTPDPKPCVCCIPVADKSIMGPHHTYGCLQWTPF